MGGSNKGGERSSLRTTLGSKRLGQATLGNGLGMVERLQS